MSPAEHLRRDGRPVAGEGRVTSLPGHLFDLVRSLDLPHDYAIFGSGPLLIRNIIDSSDDIDILCGPACWARVTTLGDLCHLDDYGVDIVSLFDGRVTFGTDWGIGDFDTDLLIDSADVIEGLRFVRLEYVQAYKSIRASAKDRRHLRALHGYLGRLEAEGSES